MSKLVNIQNVDTFYGDFQALFDVTTQIYDGEILGVVGRNGAGKTTLFKSIMGLNSPRSGTITFKGTNITTYRPEQTFDMGISYVPGDRQVFTDLTTRENLIVGLEWGQDFSEDLEVFDFFPKLRKRLNQKAGTMSGGEQQMLTIARSLISNPDLVLLDEPVEGLAPGVVTELKESILKINENTTIALIDHDIDLVKELSDRIIAVNRGEVHFEGSTSKVQENPEILDDVLTL
jgi:branched-chain amino acid transport system ATP-binding protein